MNSQKSSSHKEKPSFYIRKPKLPYQASKENQRPPGAYRNQDLLRVITNNAKPVHPERCKTQHISSQVGRLIGDQDQVEQVFSNPRAEAHRTPKRTRRMAIVPVKAEQQSLVITRRPSLAAMPYLKRDNIIEHMMIYKRYKHDYEQVESGMKYNHPKVIDWDLEKMVDWLFDAAGVFYEFMTYECLFLAIDMVKRYLSIQPRSDNLQLISGVCLFIASKMVDVKAFEMQDLQVYLTHEMYPVRQILLLEMRIVETLEFQLYSPTIFNIFDGIYQQICNEFFQEFASLLVKVQYTGVQVIKLIEKKTQRMNVFSKIEEAIASIMYSFMLVVDDQTEQMRQWKLLCLQRCLEHCSHHKLNINMIDECVLTLHRLIEQQPSPLLYYYTRPLAY